METVSPPLYITWVSCKVTERENYAGYYQIRTISGQGNITWWPGRRRERRAVECACSRNNGNIENRTSDFQGFPF